MRLANFVHLPDLVIGVGYYKTRRGETVHINRLHGGVSNHYCEGCYSDGTSEAWDKSGRLLPFSLSDNDIVEKTDVC